MASILSRPQCANSVQLPGDTTTSFQIWKYKLHKIDIFILWRAKNYSADVPHMEMLADLLQIYKATECMVSI